MSKILLYTIITVIIVIKIAGCSSSKISAVPCKFNPDRLEVIGSDTMHNAKIIGMRGPVSYVVYDLSSDDLKKKAKSFYDLSSCADPVISYKIHGCKDTTAAKKNILQEIYRRYPYTIIDSMVHVRFVNIRCIDSTITAKNRGAARITTMKNLSLMLVGVELHHSIEMLEENKNIELWSRSSSDLSPAIVGPYEIDTRDFHYQAEKSGNYKKYMEDQMGFTYEYTKDTLIQRHYIKFHDCKYK
jgi:hypothetical protein